MDEKIDRLVETRQIFSEDWGEIVEKSEHEHLLFHDSEMIRVKLSEDKRDLVVSEQNHEPIEIVHYWSNGKIRDRYSYRRISDGENILFNESHFDIDGELMGIILKYGCNGKLFQKLSYCNGKLHGNVYFYRMNGGLCTVKTYKHGVCDGETRHYHFTGSTKESIWYKNKLKNGESLKFFGEGNIQERTYYKDGKEDGLSTQYYQNGEIQNKYTYKDDKLNGYFIEYSDTGYSQGIYKDGKLEGYVQEYDIDNNLISEKLYKNDELESVEFRLSSKKRKLDITDINECIDSFKDYGDKKYKIYIEIDELKE